MMVILFHSLIDKDSLNYASSGGIVGLRCHWIEVIDQMRYCDLTVGRSTTSAPGLLGYQGSLELISTRP